MSATQHTPWQLVLDKKRSVWEFKIIASDGTHVATVNPYDRNRSEHASLIAAAPELLEACRRALAFCTENGGDLRQLSERIVSELEASIAKAEGSAP